MSALVEEEKSTNTGEGHHWRTNWRPLNGICIQPLIWTKLLVLKTVFFSALEEYNRVFGRQTIIDILH